MITDTELARLTELIAQGREHEFYLWTSWRTLRDDVLKLDHNDCQVCKAKGRRRAAEIVHHIKHLKHRPDLALSIYDGDERQLISVCWICHQELHPEKQRKRYPPRADAFRNAERWD